MKMAEMISAAKASARSKGCDCDVEIRLPNREERRELAKEYGDWAWLHHVKVLHDDHCSLLARIEGPGNN